MHSNKTEIGLHTGKGEKGGREERKQKKRNADEKLDWEMT